MFISRLGYLFRVILHSSLYFSQEIFWSSSNRYSFIFSVLSVVPSLSFPSALSWSFSFIFRSWIFCFLFVIVSLLSLISLSNASSFSFLIFDLLLLYSLSWISSLLRSLIALLISALIFFTDCESVSLISVLFCFSVSICF